MRFTDRRHAGRVLASALSRYQGREDLIVLALPRGGVPVAFEVARALGAPLDVLVVRKLGVPGHRELAMGAIASGGVRVINPQITALLKIPRETIDAVAAAEEKELVRRERAYRGARPPLDVAGKTAILIDDGLATGSTMRAAVVGLRQLGAGRIVVGVPVGARATCAALRDDADEVICATAPDDLRAVGLWYEEFAQTDDDEVHRLLAAATEARAASPRPAGGTALVDAIALAATPLTGAPADLDPLIELAGGARCVLIGEATHGTHDFYALRAELTRRLIVERGFAAVAIEGDWPDAYRVNRYVRGAGDDADATDALGGFRRFPQWMWRNADVLDFVGWLRDHNDHLPERKRIGFYGLDLYSLHGSIEAVLAYLDRTDPAAARRARERYACFDQFGEDPQGYGYAAGLGLTDDCQREVIAQLRDLQVRRATTPRGDGLLVEDEAFDAEQNARLVSRAEAYYRAMFRGRVSTWNLRDTHMADTLDALLGHLDRRFEPARIVVWAHNSHVGDASATEVGDAGELTLGQLCRQRHAGDAVLIGLSTYGGTVTAASDWGAPAERKRVRPGLPGSYEALFHQTGVPRFLLPLRDLGEAAGGLREPRLQRAIGVVYRPDTERQSHYFHARLPALYDALIHLDETRALEPMERTAGWERDELPETYPTGI